jgi:hypothetical protein
VGERRLTWNKHTVGTDKDKTPPLVRTFRYDLEPMEKLLLMAMWEHAPEGICGASRARLSAYTSISEAKIKYLINGHPGSEEFGHKPKKGLLDRRILTLETKPNAKGRKQPPRYRIHEGAMSVSPAMRPYVESNSQGEFFPKKLKVSQPFNEGATLERGHGVTGSQWNLKGPQCDPNSLTLDSLKANPSSSSFSLKGPQCDPFQNVDRSAISQLLGRFCPNHDQRVLDRIIQGVLRERADARTEEILHFLAVKGAYASRGKIENPAGFLITAVPECFAGEVFEMWRANLRADVAPTAAVEVNYQAGIIGRCLGCGAPRFASSSWSDYCADSCRAQHQGKSTSAGAR